MIVLITMIASILVTKWYFLELEISKKDGVDFVIGVSQANLTEPWRIAMTEEIKKEAKRYKNISLIITDAAMNTDKQIKDVNKLMDYEVDLLIISPNDASKLTPIVSECYKKIPVIVLDRAVEGYDYSLYIGPDNYLIGKQAGELIVDMLPNKKGKILEIQGLNNSPPAVDRSKGLHDALLNYKEIRVKGILYGNWLRDLTEDKLTSFIKAQGPVDIIFAHNDEMAYGAYRSLIKLGLRNQVKIIGVDGLKGEEGGLSLLRQKKIDGTFICLTGGKDAVQYGMSILRKEKGIPKKIILRSTQITEMPSIKYNYEEFYKTSRHEYRKERPIKLGFIQVGSESKWRRANSNSIKTASIDGGVELLFVDANQNQETQINTIRKFIKDQVDVIAFCPVVATGWTEVLKEARKANIPVILSDRAVDVKDASLYTTFIGADFEEEGRRAANWVRNHMDGEEPIDVVEIRGTSGADPVIGRSKGFRQGIADNAKINIINSVGSDFTVEGGQKQMTRLLRDYGKEIDLVFAHNDDMAIGAIKAIENYGLKPGIDIKIVSIDGTKEALDAIIKGKLNCSVECTPLLGPVLIKAVKDVMGGKELPIKIITEEGVFTQNNVKEFIHRREY